MFLLGTQKVNRKGHLEIGGCDTVDLAKQFGTPLYIMDEALIRQNCGAYREAFRKRYPHTEIAFAGKSFLTTAFCKLIEQEGLSLDVASGGELYTAIRAKFPPERIKFHGNYKSQKELELALAYRVGRIVVDSEWELDLLDCLAAKHKIKSVRIQIRVKPGIDPHTHQLIRTGQEDTKFGLGIRDGKALAAIQKTLTMKHLELVGLHCHVGSQLLDSQAHRQAIKLMVKFIAEVKKATGTTIRELNIGGGLGVRYLKNHQPPSIDCFVEEIVQVLHKEIERDRIPTPKLALEPGRSIVGEAGTTLYTIGPIKTVMVNSKLGTRTYVAIDGGMSDNPRPQLYDAKYEALLANKANKPASVTAAIAGKHCETDVLIWEAKIATPEPGDLLAVLTTGAYNYAMSSNYNRLPRPAVVLVHKGKADVIVEREDWKDIVRHDVIPERLANR